MFLLIGVYFFFVNNMFVYIWVRVKDLDIYRNLINEIEYFLFQDDVVINSLFFIDRDIGVIFINGKLDRD